VCCTDEAAESLTAPSNISCGVSSDVNTRTLPGIKLKMPVQEVVDSTTKTSQIRQSIELRQNSGDGQSPTNDVSTPFVDLAQRQKRPSLLAIRDDELIKTSKDKTVCGNFLCCYHIIDSVKSCCLSGLHCLQKHFPAEICIFAIFVTC
jgi:hypothetical protein